MFGASRRLTGKKTRNRGELDFLYTGEKLRFFFFSI